MTKCCTLPGQVPILWGDARGAELVRPMVLSVDSGILVDYISLFSVPVCCTWWREHRISRATTAVPASLPSPQPEATA